MNPIPIDSLRVSAWCVRRNPALAGAGKDKG